MKILCRFEFGRQQQLQEGPELKFEINDELFGVLFTYFFKQRELIVGNERGHVGKRSPQPVEGIC